MCPIESLIKIQMNILKIAQMNIQYLVDMIIFFETQQYQKSL